MRYLSHGKALSKVGARHIGGEVCYSSQCHWKRHRSALNDMDVNAQYRTISCDIIALQELDLFGQMTRNMMKMVTINLYLIVGQQHRFIFQYSYKPYSCGEQKVGVA